MTGLLVTFFATSIFFSFLCSILEAVLLSITPAYAAEQDGDNSATPRNLSRLKEDIEILKMGVHVALVVDG